MNRLGIDCPCCNAELAIADTQRLRFGEPKRVLTECCGKLVSIRSIISHVATVVEDEAEEQSDA